MGGHPILTMVLNILPKSAEGETKVEARYVSLFQRRPPAMVSAVAYCPIPDRAPNTSLSSQVDAKMGRVVPRRTERRTDDD